MRTGLASALWHFALAIIALVAIGAQLDRQSRYQPELSRWVPGPLRAFSQYHIALEASQLQDRQVALSEARRLIARRPVPAEHLALLAALQLQDNPQGRGLVTIQQAAKRGWREPLSQQARLRLALAAGDYREAALRLAAIWALPHDDETLEELAPRVLQHAEARQALAGLLADRPKWEGAYLRRGKEILPPEIMADIAARTRRGTLAPEINGSAAPR
ncbi:hypothetical protein [Altererythrobacter sp. Z27]|uniref:hypothetical protein n=1 Tax=Altererythrobacter sp. Z27 TaxID=3461147 RepID=UPI0040448BB1